MSPYERYRELLADLDDHVRFFELHPEFAVRQQAVALLTGLDALHREGLQRLVSSLRDQGAGAAVERAAADPIVRTLLGLYDLADLGLPGEPGSGGFVPIDRVRRSPPGEEPQARRRPA
jgi:hypothetical protein